MEDLLREKKLQIWYKLKDSHPMQYLGYCTGCNSSNINHWFNPMVVKDCHVIDPCLISFFLHFLPLHFSFSFRFTKFQKFSLPPNLDVRGIPRTSRFGGRENFWNLVNLKEKEKWSGRKWRKKLIRHGSMTWQSFTTIGLNQWLILELLQPVQYPRYCMGCESLSLYQICSFFSLRRSSITEGASSNQNMSCHVGFI